jgi:hypothetical protein
MRSVLRQIVVALALVAAQAAVVPRSAAGATINADGASCTLADAIRSANADAAPGGSGCASGLGDDLIVLDADEAITLAEAVAAGASAILGGIAGLPDVTSTITIQAGLGDTIERDPAYGCAPEDANAFRILTVGFSGNLTLDGLVLRNGCIAPPAPTPGYGGAVYAVGPLTVLGGGFVGNHVRGGSGSGTVGSVAVGGAIVANTLSLSDTLLRDNRAQGGDSDLSAGRADGGAAYVTGGGSATVVDCELRDNTAQGGDFTNPGGCGICFGGAGFGGALTTLSAAVDLRDSVLVSNAARGGSGGAGTAGGGANGGAIHLTSSTGTLQRLRVTHNLALAGDGDLGGGLALGGGLVAIGTVGPAIRDSLFASNTARGGTGIAAASGLAQGGGARLAVSAEITGSTFTGNLAEGGAATISAAGLGGGGGVSLLGTNPLAAFANSTISGNVARGGARTGAGPGGSAQGGGIWTTRPLPAVSHLTVAGNRAEGGPGGGGGGPALGGGLYVSGEAVTIDDALLADNVVTPVGGVAVPEDCFNDGGTLTSEGFNLVEAPDSSCSFAAFGDQTGVDPQLLPLADNGCVAPLPNGGCVPTVAFPAASGAADAGSCSVSGLTADQRGVARPQDLPAVPDADDGCDVGAYEATPPPPTFIFADGLESGDTSAWSSQSPP